MNRQFPAESECGNQNMDGRAVSLPGLRRGLAWSVAAGHRFEDVLALTLSLAIALGVYVFVS